MRRAIPTKTICLILLSVGLSSADNARAEDSAYICAIEEARLCEPDKPCEPVAVEDLYLAPLMIFDLNKKSLRSASMDDHGREEPIGGFERTKENVILYGHDEDDTWSTIFSLTSGDMTGSINTEDTAHILFGHCAPYASSN